MVIMKEQTITISKKEYEILKLKSKLVEKEDIELYNHLKASLEDAKHGRITKWKPKSKTK